ncbi:MAG: aminomethyl-transferring glycine dehydrogenase subunit GcvPB [Candidatus Micrarchaeota archaeon]|nr:aminomethyl-transferring glycine dehydrogenase subunit GcvPB [Candidatus Micrarchaeota archaeon]
MTMPKLIFEYDTKNTNHVPTVNEKLDLPEHLIRKDLTIPDINEVDVIRHFTELSKRNYGVDNGFYPLGSCTMKYNPRINEDVARLNGFGNLHPLAGDENSQGVLELMYNLEHILSEVTGMDAVSLQPAAGAHGEVTCCMIARKYFGKSRNKVIIPDSAHGTNPASAAMCGFEIVEVKTNAKGGVDIDELRSKVDSNTAMFMLTNPSTLGLFEENIVEINKILHDAGALTYCDGANMNAMMGITRPGDQGFDMMHLNLHKTFSTPHGGGGPGAGPICVKKHLAKYLPVPRAVKHGDGYKFEYNYPDSIGKVKGFFGNVGMLVRAYAYAKAYGKNLTKVSQIAVLSANYIMRSLDKYYHLPYNKTCAHECVFSGEKQAAKGVHTMDIAKRLLDYGFHAPTIYFPLIVKEAIMIEPTESESKATLDSFIETMKKIAHEVETQPELLHNAPTTTPVGRLDGVKAARQPNLRYEPVCRIC